MDEKLISKITLYTLKLADRTITEEEFKELNSILSMNAQAARYYNYSMMTLCNFKERGKDIICDETSVDCVLNEALWKELADYEKTAQEIKICLQDSRQELIQKVIYPPREKRKLSRLSIFALLNAAAVVLLFLVLRFAPHNGGIEVATLSDSLHAKWANAKDTMADGKRLVIDTSPVVLEEGLIKLHFDNNATVVVEGPAAFTISAQDRIGLDYGKVYVTVPAEAVGFSIYTKNAKIIDLGTEFGVTANVYGDTSLHVITGKTALIVGERSTRVSVDVASGTAKKVSADSLTVTDISGDPGYYARHFDSRNGTVWRGQPTLCLADIVGGGTGLGTGTVERGIDPTSGKPADERPGTRRAANTYRPVHSSPYIDGVFVPDGRTQQIVSSKGHVFKDCPETSGFCCESIMYAARTLGYLVSDDSITSDVPAQAIVMHANTGITFDLQALRSLLPGVHIARFQSRFGIRKWALRPDVSNADFWILVDGEIRYKKQQVKFGDLFSVDIVLSEDDRFLTLVQTDGGDPEPRILDGQTISSIHSDWGAFVNPVLVLKSK